MSRSSRPTAKFAPNGINAIDGGAPDEQVDLFEHVSTGAETAFDVTSYEDDDLPDLDVKGLGVLYNRFKVHSKCGGILVDIVKVNDAIGGMVIRKGENLVFIERPLEVDTPGILKFGETLRSSEVDTSDGVLRLTIDGVRHRCSAIGVLEPELSAESGKMKLPKSWRRPRVETLASKDDSFGKTKWRAELVEMAKKVFPNGVEAIPKTERCVVCFPGLGQEAELWKEFGFAEEDFIFIERDPDNAKHLRLKYPKATVLETEFEKYGQSSGAVGKALEYGKKKISVFSVDPESQLSEKFFMTICRVFGGGTYLADEVLFAANFYAKREKAPAIHTYSKILSEEKKREFLGITDERIITLRDMFKPDAVTPELRKAVMADLAQAVINFSRCRHRVSESIQGEYDSGASPMMYSMHKLTRPNDRRK